MRITDQGNRKNYDEKCSYCINCNKLQLYPLHNAVKQRIKKDNGPKKSWSIGLKIPQKSNI